ncbi:hypothetical protein [Tenacibaculum piscium]|uniref:hypothetical protein n=1 Tax=Tenacibaculum piscium TaxID=1458515 RepID=UPI00187B8E31|nr:hypothetical protein [Tenacibaculum piscium]MBE7691327.1 hypothetical protein [Tenacibaculum piscium]
MNKLKEKVAKIESEINEISFKNKKPVVIDGIINIEKYFESDIKILWILKEAYSEESWSYIEKFRDYEWLKKYGRRIPTLKRVIYTTYGVTEQSTWTDIPYSNEEEAFPPLEKIALINIKKIPGSNSSNDNEINKAYKQNEKLLTKQIDLCNADIIFFGNTLQYCNKSIFKDLNKTQKQISTFGNHFYDTGEKLYIDTWHPAVRGKGFTDKGYVMDLVEIVNKWKKTNA